MDVRLIIIIHYPSSFCGSYMVCRKKLVKCYVWSIALYDAETWTLRAVDQKHLEVLKCGVGGGWKRSFGLIM